MIGKRILRDVLLCDGEIEQAMSDGPVVPLGNGPQVNASTTIALRRVRVTAAIGIIPKLA